MRYLNTKTGAVVDSDFSVSGENWVIEDGGKQVLQEEIPVEPTFVSENNSPEEKVDVSSDMPMGNGDFDSITRKDIIQELDSMGIAYNPKAKKQELFDLMIGK